MYISSFLAENFKYEDGRAEKEVRRWWRKLAVAKYQSKRVCGVSRPNVLFKIPDVVIPLDE
jgi:hypothetical protein